jgi:hypothetical protein
MERALWVLGLALVCIVAAWGMWVGWWHRAGRQAGLPELPTVPQTLGEVRTPRLTGLYVSTTTAGNWQDRVVARGLGVRANATVRLTDDGVIVDRDGADPIFVPVKDLIEVTTAPGIAGKVMGQADGILIIRWRLGETELDSGIRADDRDDQAEFLVAAKDLLAGNPGKSVEATP